jgi:hypothetical protein
MLTADYFQLSDDSLFKVEYRPHTVFMLKVKLITAYGIWETYRANFNIKVAFLYH